jgi:hypothetical protein|tara:strand:- start:82 stop:357 length:276 start_codon:yes stop_codon:yes gene_type:complete
MYRWQFNFDVNNDNTIHTIHWKYEKQTDDGVAHIYGSCSDCDLNYNTMTEQQCIDSVLRNLGQTETDLQNKLTTKLNGQITPQMTKKEKSF